MLGVVAICFSLVATVPIHEGSPMLALKTSQECIWYVLGQDGTQVHQDGLLLGDPTSSYVIYPITQSPGYRSRLWDVLHSTGPQVAP